MLEQYTERSCLCVRGVYFKSETVIFKLGFGTVPAVVYLFYILIHLSLDNMFKYVLSGVWF